MKKARPTREEVLKGIGYKPLVMGKGVPEHVRAAEDRAMQDYIVAWTQGLWDHINKFDAAANSQPAERGRMKASPSTTGSQNKHFGVELFCGITPIRARPTRETLRGIYRGPGERRGARRPADTVEELLQGSTVARRAQEH